MGDLDRQVAALVALAERHRGDVMAGRTLTQHAVPITFGLKAAQCSRGLWMHAWTCVSSPTIQQVVRRAADLLELELAPPWHTSRAPLTRYADALVTATDAWGRIGNDVLVLTRPEIGELAEAATEGRGGSSTMPHTANPVLSVLIRRAALASPALALQMHLAAAGAVDERPDGAWHTERSTLATLSRRTVTAGSQTVALLEGLHVDTGRMAAVVRQQTSALLVEQRSIAALFQPDESSTPSGDGNDASDYLGDTSTLIDAILERARSDQDSLGDRA